MSSVDTWCQLSFDFNLNSCKKTAFHNYTTNYNPTTNNHRYNPYDSTYNPDVYSTYNGVPQFTGKFQLDGRVGAVVKFAQSRPAERSFPNPDIDLIVHCFILDKKNLQLLVPDKCLRVKIVSYIYEVSKSKPKIHHFFDQLSFRMTSTKTRDFESFTNCKFLCAFAEYKLSVQLEVECVKGVEQAIRRFVSDLGTLILDPIHSDVDLVVDGHTFKAHKAILAARCEYFKMMFNAEMQEQQENRVEIKEVNLDVFKLFLEYVYTGKIKEKLNTDQLYFFMVLADRFQADNLKTDLAVMMSDQMNAKNAADFLSLAMTFNNQELKTAAIDFICRNKNKI